APHFKLTSHEFPKCEEDKEDMSRVSYLSAVGSLMYAMVSHPDLAHAVSVVSRYMHNPGKMHWEAVKCILCYLKGTSNIGLSFEKDCASPNRVVGYVDSDYAGNVDARKSLSSYIFSHCGSAINWYSSLQAIIAFSTTEAKNISSTEGVKEAIWLQGMVNEFSLPQEVLAVYYGNRSDVHLTKNNKFHSKTKHIEKWLKKNNGGGVGSGDASDDNDGGGGEELKEDVFGDTIQLENAISTISQEYLLEFTSEYGIPESLNPELPGPKGKIDVYTKFFEFANFNIPISQFLFDILGHYQIYLSQLSVIGASKVSHFEINCRINIIPTLNLFRVFCVPSFNSGWMSFSKRSRKNTPQCYIKPLNSLKNWNNRFFWVDEKIFLTVMEWSTNAPKDEIPSVDMDLFSLISALNPAKVKIKTRPHVAYERGFSASWAGRKPIVQIIGILYGLVQAPRLRYLKFDGFMQKDKALTWQSSTGLSGSCP
nr:retrovirus-related Pol polyprotein from transposon TNT 1-94 [Tanacetum cinerariifolium]